MTSQLTADPGAAERKHDADESVSGNQGVCVCVCVCSFVHSRARAGTSTTQMHTHLHMCVLCVLLATPIETLSSTFPLTVKVAYAEKDSEFIRLAQVRCAIGDSDQEELFLLGISTPTVCHSSCAITWY